MLVISHELSNSSSISYLYRDEAALMGKFDHVVIIESITKSLLSWLYKMTPNRGCLTVVELRL